LSAFAKGGVKVPPAEPSGQASEAPRRLQVYSWGSVQN